jgi:hypothetical protein
VITLRHRDGRTYDLASVSESDAVTLGPAMGIGWLLGTVKPVPTFTPIGVPEPAKKEPRGELTPAFLEHVLGWLLPGEWYAAAVIALKLGASVEDVSRALGQLKKEGKAKSNGSKGKGARWASVPVAAVQP